MANDYVADIPPSKGRSPLENVFEDLGRRTQALVKFGNYIVLWTAFHMLIVGVALVFSRIIVYKYLTTEFYIIYVFSIDGFLLLVVLGAIWAFERTVKRGQILYQEISDEIEWNPWRERYYPGSKEAFPESKEYSSDGKIDAKIDIKTRILLREFVVAASLPLFRGDRGGLGYYALFNIGMSLTLWVFVGLAFDSKLF